MKLSILALFAGISGVAVYAQTATTAADKALLNQYCVTCHNQKTKAGELTIDKLDLSNVAPDANTWEKVVMKLQSGMMPPAGARRPDRAILDGFTNRLSADLDKAGHGSVNPGATALHRLNRAEYGNAVRDLIGLEVDPTTLLPGDDSSEGFDNIADVLAVSPALVERYISGATKLARAAVGNPAQAGSTATYRNNAAQNMHVEGLPLGTVGGMVIRHNFPLEATYSFKVKGSTGLPYDHRLRQAEVTVNGAKITQIKLGFYEAADFKLDLKAGPAVVGIAFTDKDPVDATGLWSVTPNNVGISSVAITGPLNAKGPGDTPSRRQIFTCQPTGPSDELTCARKILSRLGTLGYHRPVTDSDLETLLGFYQRGRNEGSFEYGIEIAISRILVDPRFMFRFEREPADAKPGVPYRVTDLELASRLSFFLWSSIPDEELLKVATENKLHEPGVLAQQTRRMLADPRSRALTQNFAGQWLALRDIKNAPANANGSLKSAFRQETELLFENIMHEDRSILELLSANYTFVDERLARHYGIPNIYGSHFRKVPVTDENRRGLLGQGSFLLVTSVADRTSPVARGKWVLENILGVPAPVPPPNVPPLAENTAENPVFTSVRERMEQHRTQAVCAACHKIMDPIGFSLENYDNVGKYRKVDGKTPINAASEMVDGTKLTGPAALREALLNRSDAFVTTATKKLMTYGLGRAVQYYDMPAVRSVVKEAKADNYRFSDFVVGIVKSDAFQMRVIKEAVPSGSAVAALH
jgi:hypothetical protein